MATYATVDDVQARYESQIPADRRDWIATRLDDAERILRDEIPSLDQRVASGRTSPETVTRVVCDMVLSLVRNPQGYTSQSAGEFSYSYSGTPGGAGGVMRLSGADRRAILGRARAGTIPAADPALPSVMREP